MKFFGWIPAEYKLGVKLTGLVERCFYLGSPDETECVAQTMASIVSAGDVLLLSGPIGSGKTVFARALIKSLLNEAGLDEDVPSPTYTLVQTYIADKFEIFHADLYRLKSVEETMELGLEDAFDNAVCIVEWPDKLGGIRPNRAFELHFGLPAGSKTARTLRIGSTGIAEAEDRMRVLDTV